MVMVTRKILLFGLLFVSSTCAFSPNVRDRTPFHVTSSISSSKKQQFASFDPFHLSDNTGPSKPCMEENPLGTGTSVNNNSFQSKDVMSLMAAITLACTLNPSVASAATANAPNAVGSALAAYGHYIALLGIVACIIIERFTIKPNMTSEEEDVLAIADTGLGIWGVLIAYTGYLRVAEYEKGWDFYSHEPIFWLKITFVGIFGAASFFNTTKIIQRAVSKAQGNDVVPMSEELAARMIQICNAELVALATIPLTATFMARGVAYAPNIPWQAGAAVSALVFGGLSFKYIKEALTFKG